jgi:TrmH family RNA methyltransferase
MIICPYSMKTIHSRDNPFFKELLKLADSPRQRRQSALTLLDGAHLLTACLDAGHRPTHLVLNEVALRDDEITALLERAKEIPTTLLDDTLFARLSELKTVTGVIALFPIPSEEEHPLPFKGREGGGMVDPTAPLTLLLENIQDPGNLGTLIRTAAAAGCEAIYFSQNCADAWSPKVLRAGMGGHFVLAIHESADLIETAKNFTGTVYATAPEAARNLYECDLRGTVAFAVGNEGAGLSAALMAVCEPVSIPMPGTMEALNAAAAAAVCLFEGVRQRGRG